MKREGTDLSIITYGAMVHESLKAAEELEKEGYSVEVIDFVQSAHLISKQLLHLLKKQAVQSLFKKHKNKLVLLQTL